LKKILFIFLMIALLSVSLVSGASLSDIPEANIVAIYDFEDATDSSSNSFDMTNNGVSFVAGVLGNEGDFELDDSDYMTRVDTVSLRLVGTDYSICYWLNVESEVDGAMRMMSYTEGDSFVGGWTHYLGSSDDLRWGHYDGSGSNFAPSWVPSLSTDYHVCTVYDGSNKILYVDGIFDSQEAEILDMGIPPSPYAFRIGNIPVYDQYFDGTLDQLIILNMSMDADQVFELGGGTGINFPVTSDASPSFNVYAHTNMREVEITDFFAVIDGVQYNTSNGTIVTPYFQNDTGTYNITVGGVVSVPYYFNYTFNNTGMSANLNATLHNAEVFISAVEGISGQSLYPLKPVSYNYSNFTINAIGNSAYLLGYTAYNFSSRPTYGDPIFALEAGEYIFETFIDGYIPYNSTPKNVSAFEEYETSYTAFDTVVTVNLKDIVTGAVVGENSYVNISGWSSKSDVSISLQNYNNTNGTISFNFLQGNYTLIYYADNYAVANTSIIIDELVEEINLTMYSYNSLWVTAVNFFSGDPLTNFSVEVFDANISYSFDDNNTGTARQNNITSGVYTVRVSKEGFAVGEYALTMTGGSHQNLIAYLVASGTETIFTVVDSISSGIIEGAQVSMYKTINSSWTLVSSQNSDITGRVQFSYVSDIQYKFVLDHADYEQRTFFLKPLFTSYTVRLTPDVQSIPDENMGSYVYEINNSGFFYDDMNNSVEISLTSGTGTIEYYNLTITNFDDVPTSINCSIANGCSDSFTLEIVGAVFSDSVVVEYWMKESGRALKYFKKVYHVQNIYDPSTLEGWKDVDDDDVDDLSKAFIAMIICLIVVGVVSAGSIMVGVPPVTASGIVLGVLVEVFAYVNFIPSLAGHLVALGCLLIVIFGRGEI